VTRASSDAEAAGTPSGPAASRIIAAESLQGAQAFDLTELAGALAPAPRRLTARDLSNETARAAYALGHRRGYEQGARAGLQQGFTEGSQALEAHQSRKAADVAGQMQRILDAFGRDMAALEAQVASDLVSLAVDIARQVLRRELSLDEQALLPAAREALRTLGEGASALEIHLHPRRRRAASRRTWTPSRPDAARCRKTLAAARRLPCRRRHRHRRSRLRHPLASRHGPAGARRGAWAVKFGSGQPAAKDAKDSRRTRKELPKVFFGTSKPLPPATVAVQPDGCQVSWTVKRHENLQGCSFASFEFPSRPSRPVSAPAFDPVLP
jgi:hypothetical protein